TAVGATTAFTLSDSQTNTIRGLSIFDSAASYASASGQPIFVDAGDLGVVSDVVVSNYIGSVSDSLIKADTISKINSFSDGFVKVTTNNLSNAIGLNSAIRSGSYLNVSDSRFISTATSPSLRFGEDLTVKNCFFDITAASSIGIGAELTGTATINGVS